MTFPQCVIEFAYNEQFVRRFNMLTGRRFRSRVAETPIDQCIACCIGDDSERRRLEEEDTSAFRAYVFDCVWSTHVEAT